MRTLAIDCATEACSVASFENGELIDGRFEVIGRGHAERLVPMVAELPDKGQAERIVVSLGPGSFTGVRIGLATARALGIAWRAQVSGYPTLALVAAMARRDHAGTPMIVCMAAGHGEWFVQGFDADGLPEGSAASLPPDRAAEYLALAAGPRLLAGNRAEDLARIGGSHGSAFDLLPDARSALSMPKSLFGSDLTPIYGRAPDARLPGSAP